MQIRPAYHIAFLVRDLANAIPDFERALGVRFRTPETLTRVEESDGNSSTPVLSTYSYEGPPYIQLIEGQPNGIYGIDQGEGLHHLGVWVDDAAESQSVLGQEGVRTQMQFARAEQLTAWYSHPADLHGVRVEYTGEIVRPGVESWLRGESSLESISAAED